jgi:hypothetical protein
MEKKGIPQERIWKVCSYKVVEAIEKILLNGVM